MSSNDQERERLRKLRERQLRERDPGPRVKVEWKGDSAIKKEPLLQLIWSGLPYGARGGLIGLLIGTIALIAMSMALPQPWGSGCGALVLVGVIPMGIILGRATDQGGYMD